MFGTVSAQECGSETERGMNWGFGMAVLRVKHAIGINNVGSNFI